MDDVPLPRLTEKYIEEARMQVKTRRKRLVRIRS